MGDRTGIAWTDATWNPTRGCRRISPGCENCYAERQAIRMSTPGAAYEGLVEVGKNGPRWTGKGRLAVPALAAPLRWKGPRRIFVDSMSDLFFEEFDDVEIAAVFAVMAAAPQHTFQVLTKRAERMREIMAWLGDGDAEELRIAGESLAARMGWCHANEHEWKWPLPNVWLGVSVEDQKRADERIPHLLATPAAIRFLSVEPLLGPVDLGDFIGPANAGGIERFADIHWVIVGGESGPKARPFELAWARSIVAQCSAAGTRCFVKQLGSNVLGLDGSRVIYPGKADDPRMWPEDLRVQEFPS